MTVAPTFRSAYRQLAQAQKPGAGVPLYTRIINRKAGRAAAAWASLRSITPNQVTAASGLLSLLGVIVIASLAPTVPVAAAATALLVVAYVLDSADGQLARLTQSGGPAGEWLDHVVDAARCQLFHLGIAVSLWRFGDVPAAAVALAWLFAVAVSVRFFAQILGEQLRRSAPPVAGRPPSGLRAVIQLPADTGIVNLLVLLLPFTNVFLVVYAAFAGANLALAAASLPRRYRELVGRQDRGLSAVGGG